VCLRAVTGGRLLLSMCGMCGRAVAGGSLTVYVRYVCTCCDWQ
jgi:hypothetical protein